MSEFNNSSTNPIIQFSNKRRSNNRIAKELMEVIENKKRLPIRHLCHKELEEEGIILAMFEFGGSTLLICYPTIYPYKPFEIKFAKGSQPLSSTLSFGKTFITLPYANVKGTGKDEYFWHVSKTLYQILSIEAPTSGDEDVLKFYHWEDSDSDIYCSLRLHPELFMPSYLPEEMRFGAGKMVDFALDPKFVELSERVQVFLKSRDDPDTSSSSSSSSSSAAATVSGNSDEADGVTLLLDALKKEGLVIEEMDGIYSFPMFTKDYCRMFLEEKENYFKVAKELNLAIIRPNTMNNYGLVVDDIGMKDVISDLRQHYMHPISRIFFPEESKSFDFHRAFIVSYEGSKDTHLDMHHDSSTVTWNICLGKEGFVGSGLTFCGNFGKQDHRKISYMYKHQIGRAVIHLGRRRHGADVITEGERDNLIIWNSNSEFEEKMALTQKLPTNYDKEDGQPDVQCLSYTHDRDFVMFKDYPPRTVPGGIHRPYDKPWCPPEFRKYDGMASQEDINARLAVARDRDQDREEKENVPKIEK